MITYNDPASADLIPAYTPSDFPLNFFILAVLLGIVVICAIIINVVRRFMKNTEKKSEMSKNVVFAGGGIGLVFVFITLMIAGGEHTRQYDLDEAEARLGVAIDMGDIYTVTLPDGTRHTDCDIEPARSWNTHNFEAQPYKLMCNGEQITAQQWDGQ